MFASLLRRTALLIVLLLGSLSVGLIAAQEAPALTESASITDDPFTITLNYPAEWVSLMDNETLYLASSETAVNVVADLQGTLAQGEFGMAVATPNQAAMLELPAGTTPIEALNTLIELLGQDANAESADLDTAAAFAVGRGPALEGASTHLYALSFGSDIVFVALFGIDPQDETIRAILNSLTLTDGDTVVALPQVETLEEGLLTLSVRYPNKWVSDTGDNTIYLATSPEALEATISASGEIPEGEMAISIAAPSILANLGLTTDASPEEIAQAFIRLTESQGDIVPITSLAIDGVQVNTVGDNIPGGSATLYVLDLEAAPVLVGIQPGGAIDDEVEAILNSISLTDGVVVVSATGSPTPPLRQWAVNASGSSQYGENSWGFNQATGAPNTDTCGDRSTAWAAASSTGPAFLVVEFAEAVIPSQINIHQTYTPGSIVQVDIGNTQNRDRVLPLPDSADPVGNTPCPGIFSLDVTGVDEPVDFVVITLDQSIGGNWNEIDAVELIGTPQKSTP